MSKTDPIRITRLNEVDYPSQGDFVAHHALHCIVGGEGAGRRYYAGVYWVPGDPEKPPFPVVFRGRVRAELCLQHITSSPEEGVRGLGLAPQDLRVARVENMPDLKTMTLR